MARRKDTKKGLLAGLLGVFVFLLGLPLFLQMGGGKWLLAEVLPGHAMQAVSLITRLEPRQEVWGVQDIEFSRKPVTVARQSLGITEEQLEKLKDFSYLKSNYIIDKRTVLLETDVDVEEALCMDFSIETDTKKPKVLIFHTHSHEGFADSDMSLGLQEGIWGTAEELKRILEEDYGIPVLHDTGRYDVVNGQTQITGAYERMEPYIRKILAENPSIEVVIDMHRDGVAEDTRLVTEVDGKSCAQIMLFNGLCRLTQDGEPKAISGLSNPYLKQNLAFSLQMQMVAQQNFPQFTRRIYLGAYRFSLHMMPRSTLIEVGAQTNTKEEAKNAMVPLAEMLATVLLG